MGFLERRWAEEKTLVKNGIMVSNLSPNTRSIRVLWFKLKLTCTSLTSSVLPQELGSYICCCCFSAELRKGEVEQKESV